MSGHSKWATTKHRKAAVDKARAKVFAKLIRQLEVAAREGGGDISTNATLRTMFEKARAASVPTDTIERAIKRGTGELEGVQYSEVTYEGYAPGGVAVIVECLTDNRNRTGAEVRNIFTRNGGSTAEPGAVSWQFQRKGLITLPRTFDEEKIMEIAADAGAEDLQDEGDQFVLVSAPADLHAVSSALGAAGIDADSAELAMVPSTTVPIASESEARRVLRLLEALDDHDDVQNVWSNFDIPDEVLAAASAE
ncbi:MAG TPA: YebC/PmpR family DNA-binding transcriptional regulator [Acidimicrobiales bacterium]|nr:YebC/PmpR family DNA-binding transcriptional regulator [Acidimicrobiales bacterium]